MAKLKIEDLNRVDLLTFKVLPKLPIVVVLDNIRSLHNIGSIFRTADAFRIHQIHLCGITAVPPHNEIHKAALGATESVSWKYFHETEQSINELKDENYQIIALEQTFGSVLLDDFNPGENISKTAIVVGNEINGVSDKVLSLCEKVIQIPQYGTKHSLNVSVATGIFLWQYYFYWRKFFK